MAKFPLHVEVEARAEGGVSCCWSGGTSALPPIPCAVHPEFQGTGEGYSPEDLFALSILGGFIASFKICCEKEDLAYRELRAKAILTMDKMPGEIEFGMTHVDVTFEVSGAKNPTAVRKALEEAIKICPVSHSLKMGKTFHLNVREK